MLLPNQRFDVSSNVRVVHAPSIRPGVRRPASGVRRPGSVAARASSADTARDRPRRPPVPRLGPTGLAAVHPRYDRGMCRNIRTLHNFEPPAADDEVRAAAQQYIRKISGFAKPSNANAEAFACAVDAVAAASARLLDSLVTAAPPKDREVEAAKARARAAQRFAA